MNSWQKTYNSRFQRGTGRSFIDRNGGVASNRPNYFFKRNGRTVPGYSRYQGRYRGYQRGRRNCPIGTSVVPPSLGNMPPTFLRPDIYAAPKNVENLVKCLTVETPSEFLGWRLYFYKDGFDATSELMKRIKLMQTHYQKFVANYDFMLIQRKGHFSLTDKVLRQDVALHAEWPTLLSDLQKNPQKTLAIMAAAMHDLVNVSVVNNVPNQASSNLNYYVPRILKPCKIYVRPIGFLDEQLMESISNLEIDQIYCVRGVVTSIGSVDFYASWVTYKCSRCHQQQSLRQQNYYPIRPQQCVRQGCLAKQGFIELRSSPFTRITSTQMIRLKESNLESRLYEDIESIPELEVELRYDLVDSVIIGQEIIVTGILKMRALTETADNLQKFSNPEGQIYMKASSILDAKRRPQTFCEQDMQIISNINNENGSFRLLVHSLAPEVHGNEMVKAGVLLSLFGGAGSQIYDEEEINVLIVGDPGVGKSGIIKMAANISNKGCIVNGKRGLAVAGNNLTAAVKGKSNPILESGGLITATNGHCCIDDIDRLISQQGSFINVMQSQVTTLPFATIYCTLSSPTSILATANSMRGHYDQSKLLTDNIRITPLLLGEFHLVFLMVDTPNKDADCLFSEHIRAVHAGIKKNSAINDKFRRKPKLNNSISETVEELADMEQPNDLIENLRLNDAEGEAISFVPIALIKKFIIYARQQVKPMLSNEAVQLLKEFYGELKELENSGNLSSITTSQLYGLIRLCQARARVDFSSEITAPHVRDIICLVKHSLADIAQGDYVDSNPSNALMANSSQSGRGNVRKFIQMLQMRSSALARRIFEFDELKDMARKVGISTGVTNLIDKVNLQGILLKRGPNVYEVILD